MIVHRLRAVDQVITAFFIHICPTPMSVVRFSKVCRLSFTGCSNASGYGLFMTGAESRTRRPILPKLRTPGVRGHFDSSTIRIAGGHHEENHSLAFCVCGLLAVGLSRAAAPRQLRGQPEAPT